MLPKLSTLLPEHPELNFEISIDYEFIDIANYQFDAGVRLRDQIAKDMITVGISPDFKMVIGGSPVYLATERKAQKIQIQVMGQITFNTSPQALAVALEG